MREEEVRMTPGFLSFRSWVDGAPDEGDKVKEEYVGQVGTRVYVVTC